MEGNARMRATWRARQPRRRESGRLAAIKAWDKKTSHKKTWPKKT